MKNMFNNPWAAEDSIWYNEERDKWDIPQQFTALTSQIRPNWKLVYEGYPKNDAGTDDKDADSVFKEILGDKYDKNTFSNACATRVSLGLLNGGVNVKKDFLIQKRKFKGKGFIASAINLKNWLNQSSVWDSPDETFSGPADITDVKSKIGDRNGVYTIIGGFGGGVSGHASLWVGSEKDVIGGHNYISYGGDIYFWELK
jgi:hypothetical protein